MAKPRTSPKVVFDPAKRLPPPSGPVSLDIAGAIARRRAQIASSSHTDLSPPADPAPTSDQSGTQVLKRPGELEKVIEQITEGFRQADLTHRASIDQQVMESFRVASFLRHNRRGGERLLDGEWVKFWVKNGRNGDAALRFVFKKVHPNAKRASFYYRATRKLFEEGVRIKDLPARVTAAGGYQELADKNVKKSRGATTTPPTTESGLNAGSTREDETRTGARPRTSPNGVGAPAVSPASTDFQTVKRAGDQTRLITVTSPDETTFFGLPLPCSVILDVRLLQDDSGEMLMQVVELQRTT